MLFVVSDPYDRAGVVRGGGEATEFLRVEGAGFWELEALQAIRGGTLQWEDLGPAYLEPEDDGLILLVQQACLVASRKHLFEHGSLG